MIIFIWDFVAENILGQIMDWMYARLVETFGEFFGMLNEMGALLFVCPGPQGVGSVVSRFGWALYLVGLVVGLFEYAIESQNGRGDIKGVALGAIKRMKMKQVVSSSNPIEVSTLAASSRSWTESVPSSLS